MALRANGSKTHYTHHTVHPHHDHTESSNVAPHGVPKVVYSHRVTSICTARISTTVNQFNLDHCIAGPNYSPKPRVHLNHVGMQLCRENWSRRPLCCPGFPASQCSHTIWGPQIIIIFAFYKAPACCRS